MHRTCAQLDTVISKIEDGVVAFFGPKGSGKSTTLLEAYYHGIARDKTCRYVDLAMCSDEIFSGFNGRGVYFFVDNAQLMRRNNMTNILRLLREGKGCIAFSSTLHKDGGCSMLACRLTISHEFQFTPFTDTELKQYLVKMGQTETAYKHSTKIPYVVYKCIHCECKYENVLIDLIRYIFDVLVSCLGSSQTSQAQEVLSSLYGFLHAGEQLPTPTLRRLCSAGFLVEQESSYELVHERSILLSMLREAAKKHFALFSQYDIGGAEELLFSDCCRRGPITVVCRGTKPYTIRGRKVQTSSITIKCDQFLTQRAIGDCDFMRQLKSPTCCLVKLAQRHPAIDFIIYETKGASRTRVLYFIQVSAQAYQERETKLDAVNRPYDTLRAKPPYEFYRDAFNMGNSSNIFYIYSSSVPIPLDSEFSKNKTEQNAVYFHQLD